MLDQACSHSLVSVNRTSQLPDLSGQAVSNGTTGADICGFEPTLDRIGCLLKSGCGAVITLANICDVLIRCCYVFVTEDLQLSEVNCTLGVAERLAADRC